MGFGDFLKNVATAAIEGAEKLGEKNLEYQGKWSEYYSRCNDEQLKREWKSSYSYSLENINRRACLLQEMRNRGLIDYKGGNE